MNHFTESFTEPREAPRRVLAPPLQMQKPMQMS